MEKTTLLFALLGQEMTGGGEVEQDLREVEQDLREVEQVPFEDRGTGGGGGEEFLGLLDSDTASGNKIIICRESRGHGKCWPFVQCLR